MKVAINIKIVKTNNKLERYLQQYGNKKEKKHFISKSPNFLINKWKWKERNSIICLYKSKQEYLAKIQYSWKENRFSHAAVNSTYLYNSSWFITHQG